MESVPRLLKQLDEGTRRLCYKNILAPKGISLTSTGKFIFTSQRNLTNAKKTITSRPLNTLTDELLRVVNAIGKTRNILLISDALEAGFKQIIQRQQRQLGSTKRKSHFNRVILV